MTTPLSLEKKRPQLLLNSLLLSIAAHIVVGGYLYYNPMLLQSPLQSLFGITWAEPKSLPHDAQVDYIDKNFLLEEVFNTLLVMPSKLHPPHDLDELTQGIAIGTAVSPQEETASAERFPVNLEETQSFVALIDKKILSQEAILKEMQEISPSPLFQVLEEKAKAVSHLQLDESLITIDVPSVEQVAGVTYADLPALAEMPQGAKIEREEGEGLLFADKAIEVGKKSEGSLNRVNSEVLTSSLDKKPSLLLPQTAQRPIETRVVQQTALKPYLEQYTFPELPPTALWNEDFTVDVSVAPHPEGRGYLFALHLNPIKDLSKHRLKQNFYFLLDRSSSSQKRRFPVFKRATVKALNSIQPEDTFNIFILDKHVIKLSPTNLPASLKNRRLAEEFLETQDANLLVSSGTIYNTLPQILSSIPHNTEMHTAILLTDGQNGLSAAKKKSLFNRWIDANNERVTLYTAAVGKENDLLSLDLLSTESGGRLLYSDTHASFPRKLAKLVLDLKTPLAKEMDISIQPHPHSHVALYPASYSLPPLYANASYVILGEIDRLAPFDLIVEGRHGEDWIGIKKKISFEKAISTDSELVKQWKKTQATLCYSKFLEEGKASRLKTAKEILNQIQKEIVFQ